MHKHMSHAFRKGPAQNKSEKNTLVDVVFQKGREFFHIELQRP